MPETGGAIIFHYPRPLQNSPETGSEVHPSEMYQGFVDAGYDVHPVDGWSAGRRRAMRSTLDEVAAGKRFEFVYSSSATTPTALTDAHHLPLHPLADWRFLARLARAGVPVGVFYPDVHWRFPFYDERVSALRAFAARRFYRYDLWWFERVVTALFMPSLAMAAHVPRWERSDRVRALAPGSIVEPLPIEDSATLRLFYVGSAMPPIYDIGPLVQAVSTLEGVHLTICCPAAHRDQVVRFRPGDNVEIVHESGAALRARYASADVACLVYAPEPYRSFAMPVKLFEAIGFGRPVLISDEGVAADFVRETGLGWVVPNDDLGALLTRLRDERDDVRAMQAHVRREAPAHSWARRAEYVAEQLLSARR